MRRFNLRLLIVFAVLCCGSPAVAGFRDLGLQQWTYADGKTIKARLLQYEPSTKTLRFAKEGDSLPYEYLLRDLNFSGKIQALIHPNFFNLAQYSFKDFGVISMITAGIWTLILCVAVVLVFLLAYVCASKIVMGGNSKRYKIVGFIRLFVIYLFFVLLTAGGVIASYVYLKSNPSLASSAAGLSATLAAGIALLVTVMHLKKYYDASTLRSLLLLVVYSIAAVLLLAVFSSAVGGVAYLGYQKLPGLMDGLLTNLVLKPFDLI